MSENMMFEDFKMVYTVTPYRKLRKKRGWTLDFAADRFHICKSTLIDIERGHKDCPKSVVRIMDEEYGCHGQLIAYWLTKFSIGPDTDVFAGVKLATKKLMRRIGTWGINRRN